MCDEPPTQAGGTCFTCRYYREPYKCPTCGQTVPEKKK